MRQVKHGSAIQVAVKAVTKKGELEGYGSVFGNIDQGFDIVEPGAFTDSLKDRGLPKMLWGHDMWEPPIGKWTEATEDDHGLKLKGQLNLDMQKGAEVHSALKMETLDGLSIGYMPKDYDDDDHGVRHLKEVDLFEVSVVTFPMNEAARVDAVKHLADEGITERQLEYVLRDAGFTRRQAKALIADGITGLLTRDALAEYLEADELKTLADNLSIALRS